jgi:lipid A 3-O-deacylase
MINKLAPLALALSFSFPVAPQAQTPPKPEERGTLSLVVENDLFVKTDRGYTSGVRLGWITSQQETPAAALQLARSIPLLASWGVVRSEYALQQAIFTPRNTTLAVPDPADRPYAGWLNASFGLIGESGPLLDQLSIGIGIVGPASLAREAQKLVHDIKGQASPAGWAFQLHNEPTLQLRYQRSWRALAAYSFNSGLGIDLTPHFGGVIGNAYTFANAGATIRFGQDLQQDYGPPRIGPSVPGSGFFVPSKKFSWYLFAGVEARAVARNIFLDGNTFESSRSVSRLPFVADLQAGSVLTFDQLRVSYKHIWRTKEFRGQPTNEIFGALSASLRW